jgi:hypothetical protein
MANMIELSQMVFFQATAFKKFDTDFVGPNCFFTIHVLLKLALFFIPELLLFSVGLKT